ncbi:MAG: PUR family DNA/RNA-binding protein [Bacteroidales bacterium]|nr:PUR family DNA/RNA-binding protein [Bacteroidales bacterium]
MYRDDFERPNYADRNSDDVWSKPVRAGKRTYFFDVKTTKGNNDYYLTITESKRRQEADGSFSFDKHKIFLYKEDFDKFREGLEEVIQYMKDNLLKDIPEYNGPSVQENAPDTPASADVAPKEGNDHFTEVNFDEL